MRNLSTPPVRLFSRIAPLALMLLASANLYAQQATPVTLSGSTVVPPVVTTASGSGQITVTPDYKITGSIKVGGLVPTVAHIHEAEVGKNGPPIITLEKTTDGYVVPANTRLNEVQYASFMSGKLYVHVHTAKHPDGELRGQLLPAQAADKAKSAY